MYGLKTRYPIGIDIGDQAIYAAQFKKTRQGISVRELFHRKLDNGQTDTTEPDDTLIPVLKEVAKNKRFRGKSVVIRLPTKHVNSALITFEVGAEETLEDAIARECRRYLTFPIEEAVIDYPSIVDISSGKNNRFKANIISVRRDQIEQYINLLKRAGLSVEAIDFDLSSLLRLHNYLFSIKDGPVILCNIGHSQSLISVVTNDNILAHRNVTWGTQSLLNRLETTLELSSDSEQAASILTKYGLYYGDSISPSGNSPEEENRDQDDTIEIYRSVFQILAPLVDKLLHEFYQITGYVRSEIQEVKFEEIYMYGQASLINFLDKYLKNRLNIPTKLINPMSKLTLQGRSLPSDTVEGATFAIALGLALRKVTWL
jgi:type IV pilus assembly protein PilM